MDQREGRSCKIATCHDYRDRLGGILGVLLYIIGKLRSLVRGEAEVQCAKWFCTGS